jgi:hypothetical protein
LAMQVQRACQDTLPWLMSSAMTPTLHHEHYHATTA